MRFLKRVLPLLLTLMFSLAEAGDAPIQLYGRASVADPSREKSCSICIDCDGFSSGIRKPITCHPSLLDGVKIRVLARPQKTGSACGLAIVGKPQILPPEFVLPTYPNVAELNRTLDCAR